MSTKKQLLILILISSAFYFICWTYFGFELSEEMMFSSTDSKGYLDVVNWIFGGNETIYTAKRPLLFPLIIGLPYQLFGVAGIWILHFCCWLLTISFTFSGLKKWTNNSTIAWIASSILILNISLIALTFQGITEIVSTALLSLFFYHIARGKKNESKTRFGNIAVLILVLLTLVKPLFYYPTLIGITILLIVNFKVYIKNFKSIIYPVIIVLPLLFQMTFMKVNHGTFAVSTIGKETFNNYFFAKTVRDIEGLDEEESQEFVHELSRQQQKDYLMQNKGMFIKEFFQNIEFNIKGEPMYLTSDFAPKSILGFEFMAAYNRTTFPLHILGLLLLIITSIVLYIRKEYSLMFQIVFIGGLSTYYIITSGISFWQGDRLVLPSIALWAPLYVFLIYFVVKKFKTQKIHSNKEL